MLVLVEWRSVRLRRPLKASGSRNSISCFWTGNYLMIPVIEAGEVFTY